MGSNLFLGKSAAEKKAKRAPNSEEGAEEGRRLYQPIADTFGVSDLDYGDLKEPLPQGNLGGNPKKGGTFSDGEGSNAPVIC